LRPPDRRDRRPPRFFGHDEWENFAQGIKKIEDATALRRKVLLAFELAETEPRAEERRRLLSFVIVGGGPTGVRLPGPSPSWPARRSPPTSATSTRVTRASSSSKPATGCSPRSTQNAPLQRTRDELVDCSLLATGRTRLTVGAAHVRTSSMRYFDSRDMQVGVRHIMASGALPPAFPAGRIDGDLYWDGGILSNTPVETVFDDDPRQNGLIFAVHIWNPVGPEPETLWQVFNRHKDIQYSSRAATHIARQKQIHRLRHVIAELAKRLPEAERSAPAVRELAGYGCLTRMHVVRLLAPSVKGEDHSKDIDFSPDGISTRWRAGLADTRRVLAQTPWIGDFDPIDGLFLHEG
jgi:predicted acylesterase/phospholipase RssA